jgi:hypothetical protein
MPRRHRRSKGSNRSDINMENAYGQSNDLLVHALRDPMLESAPVIGADDIVSFELLKKVYPNAESEGEKGHRCI